jgi:gamma-glutamylcyclotransferase (GGCT)/AIG2-like uncharacterized protein YtfP
VKQVFVYGTLRPPHAGTAADDSRFYHAIALYVGRSVAARLSHADLYDLGGFPGARPGEGVIHGDLLVVEDRGLDVMDRIEGHPRYFRRERVEVATEDGVVPAWIYWASEEMVAGRARIPGGDWFRRATGSSG